MEGWVRSDHQGVRPGHRKGGGWEAAYFCRQQHLLLQGGQQRLQWEHLGWGHDLLSKLGWASYWENFTVFTLFSYPAPLFMCQIWVYYRKGSKGPPSNYILRPEAFKDSMCWGQLRGGIKSSSEISAGKLLGRKTQLSLFIATLLQSYEEKQHWNAMEKQKKMEQM